MIRGVMDGGFQGVYALFTSRLRPWSTSVAGKIVVAGVVYISSAIWVDMVPVPDGAACLSLLGGYRLEKFL